jgi:membrane fusion protein, heavy metal efflux system
MSFSRFAPRLIFAVALATTGAGAALAADTAPAATFAFSAEQIKSLAITLSAPRPAHNAAGSALSAKVIAAPDAEWVVTAPTSAVIIRVPVAEGDTVAAGAVLAELLQAESAAQLARAERERDRQLHQEGIIAARRLQASEQAAAQAESQLAALRMQLQLMGISAQDARNGRVLARAPARATVLDRLVTPGQRVNEADPLLRLVDADKLMLELQVPIADPAFAVGDTLTLPDGRRATVRQAG